jgi:hypothetical protein
MARRNLVESCSRELWSKDVGPGTFLDYRGWFDEALVQKLGEGLRTDLAEIGVETVKPRDIFSVYVELAQNIVRYSNEIYESDENKRFGSIRVGTENGGIYVASQNKIAASGVEPMRDRLTQLASMDDDTLKALYKSRLRGDSEPGSKGASVGFIQIARQARKPLEFDFTIGEEGENLFTIKVTL